MNQFSQIATASLALASSEARPLRLQRKCACEESGGSCSRCASDKLPLQGKATNGDVLDRVPPIVSEVLASPGQPLDTGIRTFMEQRFERDFSNVRIHSDQDASASAEAVGARAYTVGPHIVLGEGASPSVSPAGIRLLAHELAHVVQQAHSDVPAGIASDPGLERDADRAASDVMVGRGARVETSSDLRVSREPYRQAHDIWSELSEELQLKFGKKGGGTLSGSAADVRDTVRLAQSSGLMRGAEPGVVDAAFQSYKYADVVRDELGLPGNKLSRIWNIITNSRLFQAAHIGPGEFLRYNSNVGDLPGYQYENAPSSLLESKTHAGVDAPWKGWLRGLRKQKVPVVSASQLYEKMAEGIRNSERLSPRTKGVLEWRLHMELYKDLGRKLDDELKVPPRRGGKMATGALAAIGAALEYKDLKASGLGTLESGAQALGGGLGSFAAPGGMAGMLAGFGSTGIDMVGGPKPLSAGLRVTGDVLNFTGATLGQTLRGAVNVPKALVSGDWKDFDHQVLEMKQGKAGLPLEGLARWVDLQATLAPVAVDQGLQVLKGQRSANEAAGELGDRTEAAFLKQKFVGIEDDLWNMTAAPAALRQIKIAEGLIRGKDPKQAVKESQDMDKNALINRVNDWTVEKLRVVVPATIQTGGEMANKIKKEAAVRVEGVTEKLAAVKRKAREGFAAGKEMFGKYFPF